MLTVTDAEWDVGEDQAILAQFLATRTGSRIIPKLLESAPGLLGTGDTNTILIRSGEVRGWHSVLSALVELARGTPKVETETPSTNYPALEDDQAWKDGQKLSSQ